MRIELRSISMISKIAGNILKKDTKTKQWWAKLAVAIVLSNIFFFVLFSGNETQESSLPPIPEGWVEIHVRGELLTPFQTGKKVLLLHRIGRERIEAMLETSPLEPEGRFTVLVKESEAEALLKHENWEIVPFLKTLTFSKASRGVDHEIRY
jgi:hypothetical protein